MRTLLDNIFWHALVGPQAKFATGDGAARRYASGFSPILGFADPMHPDFDAARAWCSPEERFYVDGWSGPVPAGWGLDTESTMFKMVWEGGMPAPADAPGAGFVPLGPEHAERALELALLTRPGPFGLRTIELGDYIGCFEGERLVAMAGERSQAGVFREVSGVCTHPDFQGRGLAWGLMLELIRRQMQSSEVPFLHVTRDNIGAQRFYRRMGFVDYRESVVRVVSLR